MIILHPQRRVTGQSGVNGQSVNMYQSAGKKDLKLKSGNVLENHENPIDVEEREKGRNAVRI